MSAEQSSSFHTTWLHVGGLLHAIKQNNCAFVLLPELFYDAIHFDLSHLLLSMHINLAVHLTLNEWVPTTMMSVCLAGPPREEEAVFIVFGIVSAEPRTAPTLSTVCTAVI